MLGGREPNAWSGRLSKQDCVGAGLEVHVGVTGDRKQCGQSLGCFGVCRVGGARSTDPASPGSKSGGEGGGGAPPPLAQRPGSCPFPQTRALPAALDLRPSSHPACWPSAWHCPSAEPRHPPRRCPEPRWLSREGAVQHSRPSRGPGSPCAVGFRWRRLRASGVSLPVPAAAWPAVASGWDVRPR